MSSQKYRSHIHFPGRCILMKHFPFATPNTVPNTTKLSTSSIFPNDEPATQELSMRNYDLTLLHSVSPVQHFFDVQDPTPLTTIQQPHTPTRQHTTLELQPNATASPQPGPAIGRQPNPVGSPDQHQQQICQPTLHISLAFLMKPTTSSPRLTPICSSYYMIPPRQTYRPLEILTFLHQIESKLDHIQVQSVQNNFMMERFDMIQIGELS